ncbi:transposase [Flavobacterium sp. '19STA2R22 D10 B1']|uniref:transposase n=1 Tax=Flavobacterium aerium TaxID=3037261 RepID=UPI00278BC20F|nr:transposase [Flavobacterium sp. '19STA2R22 D10 B1']
MKKRVYSAEFKSSAVRLSYERENIKELADELGIQVARIYKWRSSEKTFINPKPIISKKIETDSLEVKQLRKALKEKELELEILKKAVHIFSKSDGKSTNS